jgi:putative peptidoglycan lipid II flippase
LKTLHTPSQAFVPVFITFEKEHGKRETWRLTSLVFNVMLVTLTGLVLIAEFAAPAFVSHWLVPGYTPSEQNLTTSLTRIMLLQPLILGLGTIATAVLSSKHQFLLPAFSIAVYNFGLIGGLLVTLAFPGVGIYGPTCGVLAAAACQVLVQLPGLVKQRFEYSFTWDLKHPGLHQVMLLLGPNIIAVAIVSIASIVDTAFTSFLPDKASLAAIHPTFRSFGKRFFDYYLLHLLLVLSLCKRREKPQK